MSDCCRRLLSVIALFCVAFVATSATAYDWLQFNGSSAHSGNNTSETTISAANVATLTQLFQVSLPNVADGAPVLLQGVTTPAGVQDLLFVNTTDGWIVALNAQTGMTVWGQQLTGASPFMTTSPAIDPNGLYVYSYGLDGYAHKFPVGTGIEVKTGGWPVQTTLKPTVEKASAPLATATVSGTSYLYVVHGGYPGDGGSYQGHLSSINLGTAAANVFNAMCSNQSVLITSGGCVGHGSAIWGRPGAVYDAGAGKIYVATGNATDGGGPPGCGNPGQGTWNGSTMWSESLLALNPSGTGGASGKPLDSYTPTDVNCLDQSDTDIGSTAVAILPVPANSNVQHLGVLGGKDSVLRLLDLDNLSDSATPGPGHQGGEIFVLPGGIPQGGELLSQPCIWVNPADGSTWVFIGNGGGLSGLQLAVDGGGNPSLVTQWQRGAQSADTSPLIANNVLYFHGNVSGSNVLTAYTPTTGSPLWSVTIGNGVHWQSPVVANGATDAPGLSQGRRDCRPHRWAACRRWDDCPRAPGRPARRRGPPWCSRSYCRVARDHRTPVENADRDSARPPGPAGFRRRRCRPPRPAHGPSRSCRRRPRGRRVGHLDLRRQGRRLPRRTRSRRRSLFQIDPVLPSATSARLAPPPPPPQPPAPPHPPAPPPPPPMSWVEVPRAVEGIGRARSPCPGFPGAPSPPAVGSHPAGESTPDVCGPAATPPSPATPSAPGLLAGTTPAPIGDPAPAGRPSRPGCVAGAAGLAAPGDSSPGLPAYRLHPRPPSPPADVPVCLH